MADGSEYLMSLLLSSAAALAAAIFSVAREDVSFAMGVCSTCLVGLSLRTLLGSWDCCNKQHNCQFCLAFVVLSLILLFSKRIRLFRYWISSLYFFFRGRPKQIDAAPIWRLPPELVLYITEGLPPAAAAAFALTSTAIMNMVGLQFLELEGTERLALLEYLQSELRRHLLCYQCSMFHTKSSLSQNEHHRCIRKNGRVTMAMSELRFTEAQQAMNNHLYGSRHPVDRNRGIQRAISWGDTWLWEQSELRVYQDTMLFNQQIAMTINWKGTKGPKRYAKRKADDGPISLCPHLRCSELLDARHNTWTYFECPVCGTEISAYRRPLGGKHDKNDEILDLDIYRSLGSCRSPFDSQWGLVTGRARRRSSLPRARSGLRARWAISKRLHKPSLFALLFSSQFRRE